MLQDEAGKPRPGGGPASGVRRCGARASRCDELLNGEIFYTLNEAKIVIEARRRHDNTMRPHSPLGYRPSAPEVIASPTVKAVAPMQTLN